MRKFSKASAGFLPGLFLILLLVITALPALFMNQAAGYVPLLTLLILLGLSGLSLYLRKRSVTVEAEGKNLYCLRGEKVNLGLKLINHSNLIGPAGTAHLRVSDLFGNTDASRTLGFALGRKDAIDFAFGLDMNHLGVYEVGLEQITLSDFTGLFHTTIPAEGQFQTAILPIIRDMEDLIVTENMEVESAVDTRTAVVGGTDYTGVREYVPGDPMKQIHWKLSAHSRGYMTKLQESARRQEYAVILDFSADSEGLTTEDLMDVYDTLIETALSITNKLKQSDTYCALFYGDKHNQMARTSHTEQARHMDLIRNFSVLTPEPSDDYPDACRIMAEESRRSNHSTNVIIVTQRITEELLQAFERASRAKRNPELFFVMPAAYNSRKREALAARLERLTDSEIPWYPVFTEEHRN